MTTYLKVLQGAFLDIGVKAAESPLSPSEISDGLTELNDMLAEWDLVDIIKGIEPDEDAGIDMMEPRGWTGGIRANVAVRLAGQYERPVTQSLAVKASRGYNAIVISQYNQQDYELPDTLPTGQGNCNTAWIDDEFFPTNSKRNF